MRLCTYLSKSLPALIVALMVASRAGAGVSIVSPSDGSIVNGVVTITVSADPSIQRVDVFVDTSLLGSSSSRPYTFSWNSADVADGVHRISANGYKKNSRLSSSAAISVTVQNTAPTPTPTPTPGPPPTPGHLSNVGPQTSAGPIQDDTACAALADQSNFPETTPKNVNDGTGWNVNNQIWNTPLYFYNNAGRSGFAPNVDFQKVDGNYSGTTQDIIRWAACKWGVDEDWAYAESQEENGGWYSDCAQLHGGSGCDEGGDCGNSDSDSGGETANLSATLNGQTFQLTNSSSQFIGLNGLNGTNHNGSTCRSNWMSWGIMQTKVGYYEWYTWPMQGISTAWSEDYRWAKWRACVNGDLAGFFGNPSDYSAAVSAAASNPDGLSSGANTKYLPNETNLQYLGLGCVGAHYSGAWYQNTDSYLKTFVSILNSKSWPGGQG